MQKLLLICLLAVPGSLLSQNIDLKDLQWMLYSRDAAAMNNILEAKGFTSRQPFLLKKEKQLAPQDTWGFSLDPRPNAKPVTTLYRSADTTHPVITFSTSNAFFYAGLMNQLKGEGFSYRETLATGNDVTLRFSNNAEDLLLTYSNEADTRNYRFTFQKATPSAAGKMIKRYATQPTLPVKRKTAIPARKKATYQKLK